MDIEDLKWILGNATESVRNIDVKNSILTAIIAAVAAILFSGDTFFDAATDPACTGWIHCAKTMCLVLIALASIVSTVALIASLVPRSNCQKPSLVYSGSIGEFESAEKYASELSDEKIDLRGDLICQIHITSTIYRKKTFWNKVATISVACLITVLVTFACICMIGA